MDVLREMDIFSDARMASILIGLIIPIFLYWFATRNHNYWKKHGIPFEKPFPVIGSTRGIFSGKTLEELEVDRYKRLGNIYGYYEGTQPLLIVSEPELLKNIFVKDFQYFPTRRIFDTGDEIFNKMLSVVTGEDWKRIRTIVTPTFTTGKIKKLMSIFQDCAKTLTQNFKMAAAKSEPVDVLKIYSAFTMDVIASSAFSTKLDSHNNPNNDFVKNAKSAFTQDFGLRFLLFLFFPTLMKKLGFKIFPAENMDFFKNVTLEILAERKRTGQVRNDFLQLLIDTAKEVEKEEKLDEKAESIISNYGDDSISHPVFKTKTASHLSMNELIAQCIIFFLAGYHTTATTLSLTTYLLALNEDIQDKVFEEISDVLSETNGELKYESIQKMKYLDNVISEVLRLYPPLIRIERTAAADYKLGDTGINIPKGMVLGIPAFAMHRDPKFFPDPMKFNPDRFTPEEREKQIPYTYLPFGVGPRNCVAMRFALVELKVCLINVFSAFQAKKCSQTKVPLDFGRASGLLQPISVVLNMVPRTECPLNP